MGILDGAMFFLSGPIDDVSDDGVGFRKQIRRLMTEEGITNVTYFDPTDKPVGGHEEIGEEKKHSFALRKAGKFRELRQIVKQFRRQDLRYVDYADCVIGYIDPDVHMCGSYDEIFLAERQQKPLYLVIKGGRTRCPLWLFGVVDTNEMFDSVDDLVEYLGVLHKGFVPLDSRWVLSRRELYEVKKPNDLSNRTD